MCSTFDNCACYVVLHCLHCHWQSGHCTNCTNLQVSLAALLVRNDEVNTDVGPP